ncbi:MAG: hypothetical protein ACK42I_01785, partial [Thermomicrobium sp.]
MARPTTVLNLTIFAPASWLGNANHAMDGQPGKRVLPEGGANMRNIRYTAGVKLYSEQGYWDPSYVPGANDILCCFRVTP